MINLQPITGPSGTPMSPSPTTNKTQIKQHMKRTGDGTTITVLRKSVLYINH